MSVRLIVPCYNEAKRLDRERFIALSEEIPLLFVDDGSSDSTWDVLQSLAEHPNINSHKQPKNGGKAEAVRSGMLLAMDEGADVVGFFDADLATPPDEMLRLNARQVETQKRVVMGSRILFAGAAIERYAWRHYIGRGFATAASMILKEHFYDTQCGAKLFVSSDELRRALSEPFLARWIFDVELLGRLLVNGYTFDDFLEVPLNQWVDVDGSKISRADFMKAFSDLVKVQRDLARRRG